MQYCMCKDMISEHHVGGDIVSYMPYTINKHYQ